MCKTNRSKQINGVGWGMVGGPCDFNVSQSPFGVDFGTLDFGTSDSGLTKNTRLEAAVWTYKDIFGFLLFSAFI